VALLMPPDSQQPKQNKKTKKYWDSFYSELSANLPTSAGTASKNGLEWIVANSSVLLNEILQLFPVESTNGSGDVTRIEVLEIGCGVSELSCSLLEILVQQRAADDLQNLSYGFVSTDVSPVCIDHNQKRDDAFISLLDTSNGNSSDDPTSVRTDSLRYEVLDVLVKSETTQQYDVILDKGTLDTFLFRSKRTSKCSERYPPLLLPILNNIHQWLRLGGKSKYIIISPRAKIKAVRDYIGFASVRRIKLDVSKLGGTLLLESNVKNNSDIDNLSRGYIFIYECTRNDDYKSDVDTPFRSESDQTVDDPSICPKCQHNFKAFRGSIETCDQGVITWIRRWKNHIVHCKGL
jgi:hypothetical protein